MSTSPLPKPEPTGTNRRRLIGLGVFLAFLVFLLVLASYGLGLWGSGELTTP
jgi:hypothetical protein